jgi:hypothetical protein
MTIFIWTYAKNECYGQVLFMLIICKLLFMERQLLRYYGWIKFWNVGDGIIYVIRQANWRGYLLAMGNVKEKIAPLYMVLKNVFGIGKK